MKPLDTYWDDRNGVSLLLLPLSWLFCFIAWLRRLAYRCGLLKVHRLPVPVIVVGNITVGGTGKTPLVIWLAEYLGKCGFHPGIVARGYAADTTDRQPRQVRMDSSASEVGDEPLLIVRRTGCPMYIAADRVAAARALLENSGCDVIISDDGMQHYALGRDIEIAVIDGTRRFGNGFCLPAGPLRERPSRLAGVDLVIANGKAESGEHLMTLCAERAVSLQDPHTTRHLDDFAGQALYALAGIGNPGCFFQLLRARGLQVRERSFPDHYRFTAADIAPEDELPLLMTEKDAVKCTGFAGPQHWYVPVDAKVDEAFTRRLEILLRGFKSG